MKFLFVVVGAALGAPTRFLVDQYARKFSRRPYGIFLINILGSFIVGLTFGSSDHIHALIAIGFAGAFTTWSTFILDIYLAYELKNYREVLINLLASLSCGLLAAWWAIQLVSA